MIISYAKWHHQTRCTLYTIKQRFSSLATDHHKNTKEIKTIKIAGKQILLPKMFATDLSVQFKNTS